MQLIVLLTIFEALFFTFSLSLELSIALGALIILIFSQLFIVSRKIRVKRDLAASSASRAADVIKTLKKTSKKSDKKKSEKTAIDPNLFSKFQENIDQSSKESTSSTEDEAKEVILSLSKEAGKKPIHKTAKAAAATKNPYLSKNKQKVVVPSSKGDSEKSIESLKKLNKDVPVEPIGSLFDDVQENLKSKPKENSEEIPSKPAIPISSNEFLTAKDLTPDDDSQSDSVALVLAAARNEFDAGKFENSLATIRQFLQSENQKNVSAEQMIQLLELKGQNEFELEQFDRASKSFQTVVTRYITKSSPDFLPTLEGYIDQFLDQDKQKHAIHFMFTALNEYRQMHDHAKMDLTYDEIENAYRQQEDWPRLIQTYQNHLSIKKVLKDYEGQLDLLDQLGKLLYDQGEEDKSRKCYEQRLVVENEMSRAGKS